MIPFESQRNMHVIANPPPPPYPTPMPQKLTKKLKSRINLHEQAQVLGDSSCYA